MQVRERRSEIKFIKKDDRCNRKNVVLQDSRMFKECAKCKKIAPCSTGRDCVFIQQHRASVILYSSNRKAEISACRL